MDDLNCITNHLGNRQYVTEQDEHVCPNCLVKYTNEGEGVLCDKCGDTLHDAQMDTVIVGQW